MVGCIQVSVRSVKCLAMFSLIGLAGCVHFQESSATAGVDRIQEHISSQLHCEALHLEEKDRNCFSGAGKNQTGEFTIEVARDGDKITFHGVYTGQTHGTFSGSASWNKYINSAFGMHTYGETSQNSIGTP
jgi:hypothetical protein